MAILKVCTFCKKVYGCEPDKDTIKICEFCEQEKNCSKDLHNSVILHSICHKCRSLYGTARGNWCSR